MCVDLFALGMYVCVCVNMCMLGACVRVCVNLYTSECMSTRNGRGARAPIHSRAATRPSYFILNSVQFTLHKLPCTSVATDGAATATALLAWNAAKEMASTK